MIFPLSTQGWDHGWMKYNTDLCQVLAETGVAWGEGAPLAHPMTSGKVLLTNGVSAQPHCPPASPARPHHHKSLFQDRKSVV